MHMNFMQPQANVQQPKLLNKCPKQLCICCSNLTKRTYVTLTNALSSHTSILLSEPLPAIVLTVF